MQAHALRGGALAQHNASSRSLDDTIISNVL
jgi:hypothetical protein